MIVLYTLVSLTLVSIFFAMDQAYADTLKSNRSHCYAYLTELVRSSNFPFTYVKSNKANLLIDDDQGETVSAQVVFDTNGSGTMGWVQYEIRTHQLLNTSVDLEAPEPLTFERVYAEQYERCIKKNESASISD
ncbi:hypothetical protein NNO07_27550 [Pseudomonas resinovorans]|uniref:Uncharacterized protein n=1 Tax=Metapseudomonas resinovorans TaxID=53412 RepID=A0ABT4YDM9_METRE|nr:hypothetical protein [Pseudomonas resinovorans]MDA8486831.1 hypothetical protein [Pseudomonas resinovorans]